MSAMARTLRTGRLLRRASLGRRRPAPGRRSSRRRSSVVTCRKTSSRLMRIGRSSSRPQPRVDDRRARARGGRRAPARSRLRRRPSRCAHVRRRVTRVTPGHAASAARGVRARRVDLHVHRLRAAQPRGQVVGRVDRDDAALVDDDDALAGLRDLRQDVRAEDDRVVAGEAADQIARLDDLLRVEAGGRLVEDQHLGVVDDRLRQADALPVALRQLAAVARRPCRRRACAASRRRRASCARATGTPLMRATKSRYSRTRHVGVERRRFRQVAGAPLGLERMCRRRRSRRPWRALRSPACSRSGCASSWSCRRRWGRGSRGFPRVPPES